MGGADGAGAQVPCEPVCGWRIGDFAFGDGGVDDSADAIDPVCEGVGVVDGGFEGEFHPGAQIGVISDLVCQGGENRSQTIERDTSSGMF